MLEEVAVKVKITAPPVVIPSRKVTTLVANDSAIIIECILPGPYLQIMPAVVPD
jgi:hypothetical protein